MLRYCAVALGPSGLFMRTAPLARSVGSRGPTRPPNEPPLGFSARGTGEGQRKILHASETIRRPMSKRVKGAAAEKIGVDPLDGHAETQRLIDELAAKRATEDVVKFQPTVKPTVPVGKPGTVGKASFWNRTIVQPINPQLAPQTNAPLLPKSKPSRMSNSGGVLHPHNKDRATHRLSDDQLDTVVNHYAAGQWYGFIWKRISWIDIDKMKGLKKWAHMGVILAFFGMFFVVYFCYFEECDLLSQLEEDELRDWNVVIWGMRMSEISKVSEEILNNSDPLRVLPPKEQMSLVVQGFRDRGYLERDFELENRTRASLLREPDVYHIFYWMVMYLGRALCGSTVAIWNYKPPA